MKSSLGVSCDEKRSMERICINGDVMAAPVWRCVRFTGGDWIIYDTQQTGPPLGPTRAVHPTRRWRAPARGLVTGSDASRYTRARALRCLPEGKLATVGQSLERFRARFMEVFVPEGSLVEECGPAHERYAPRRPRARGLGRQACFDGVG